MIDLVENFNGILSIFINSILTGLEIFFGPVLAVIVTPLLQILNGA